MRPDSSAQDAAEDHAPARCRRRVLAGWLAVAMSVFCGALLIASINPLLTTGDETAHLDYGYQMWHGQLPSFDDGVVIRPGAEAEVPPVQWAFQHPPLYYLLLAPIVGPRLDAGDWQGAAVAGRVVSVLIAVGAVGALGWAGAQIATRRRWAWAIVVPAVVAPLSPFLAVGGAIYNDNLSAALVALALGLALRLIRRGPSPALLLAIAVVCGLGALSRANFIATLVMLTGAVPLGVLLHQPIPPWRRAWLAAASALLPLASALAVSGWFYLRNIRLTGNWTGSRTDYAVNALGRVTRSLGDVLTWPEFWTSQLMLFRYSRDLTGIGIGQWTLVATALIGLVAALGWFVRDRRRVDLRQLAVVAVLAGQAICVLALEVAHAMNGGGLITRYLLPGLLPIGALLAAGVLAFGRRLSGIAYLLYAACTWGLFARWVFAVTEPDRWAPTTNGLPGVVIWLCVALIGGSALVTAVTLTERRPASTLRAR